MEGHWKFLEGGGILKAKFLEAMYMYENKLEGGAKQKTFRGGGGKRTLQVTIWP